MAQRRHHYEQAFEDYLRARRIPYVAVDEAKKALLPEPGVSFRQLDAAQHRSGDRCHLENSVENGALKSFDFVIYGQGTNLLVEVKGRKVVRRVGSARPSSTGVAGPGRARGGRGGGRFENWVTLDDVASLSRWEQLFGPEFHAAFVFVYWCDDQPPDALFQEMFECRGRWYALRSVKVRDYTQVMKVRSPRWRTVNVPPAAFERISAPFAPPRPYPLPPGSSVTPSIFHLEDGVELPALERLIP
ncbi:MAG TPA: HYExAFE family protein [Phycisphaerales bacterium]|nr:HYExAFE family protein [Phycisphaerales bacterium]